MKELLKTIVTRTDIYATQNGCDFETTKDKIRLLLIINFINRLANFINSNQ